MKTKQEPIAPLSLTAAELARAATNDPALSEREFLLGDRVFKIVDLEYDDYMKFIALLEPALEAFAHKLAGAAGISAGTESVDTSTILKHCTKNLPELARIVCAQTDSSVTVAQVKKLGKSPFKLAAIILQQIEQNKVISDITDFFVQILPLLTMGRGRKESRTVETPSS